MSAVEVDLAYPESIIERRSTPYGLHVTLDGAAGIGEPGEPALPRAVVRIALPEGAVATGVSATVLSTVEMSAEPVRLAPVQPPRAGEPVRVALPDPENYPARARPLAVLLDAGDAEVAVATVEVNPLAVDGAGRLVRHERIRVVVPYQTQRLDGRRRFRDQREATDHLRMLRQLVVNPALMNLEPAAGVEARGAEYLVITDRHRWDAATITRGAPVDGDPVAEFGRLTAWKRARGLTARVVTVEDIVDGRYGDFGALPPRRTARDLPEVIRQFLKHARTSWGTRWVLLGGEPGIVPIRVVAGIPTDFYYASLTGPQYDRPGRHDWDPRGTGVHSVDAITWQAHLSVGRAPVRGGVDAAAFVDKVLVYEQLPETGYWLGGHVYEREMVVATDTRARPVVVYPTSVAGPGDHEFHTGADRTTLHLTTADVPITYELNAELAGGELRRIPYDEAAGPGRRGWHYTASSLAVFSTDPEELAPQRFVLDEPTGPTDEDRLAAIARGVLRGTSDIRRLPTTALTTALNEGPHLVSLSGPGSPCGGVCGLDSWLAASLSNGQPGFIAYADAPLTAAVDQDCVGERLLTNPDGGAVAYVGNTRHSWTGDFQRLFWLRLATTTHLGLLADSRCELVHTAGLHPTAARRSILSLNLLGDPELPVWRRRPRRLRVPERIADWEWVVRDERGRTVPDAVVTVTGRDRPVSARADERGVVRFDLTGLADGRVEVVVTAPGSRPARSILELTDRRALQKVVASDPR